MRDGWLVGYGVPPPVPDVAELRDRLARHQRRGVTREAGVVLPLHVHFARLHGQRGEAFRAFAQRWGFLGLIEATAGRYLEAMERTAAVFTSQEGESLGDIERRLEAERRSRLAAMLPELMVEAAHQVLRGKTPPRGEPLREWRVEAERVGALVKLAALRDALRAGAAVEPEAVRGLLAALGWESYTGLYEAAGARGFAAQADVLSGVLAEAVNATAPLTYRLTPGGGLHPVLGSLRDAIYASLALHLGGGTVHRLCRVCGRPFVADDPRRQHCPPEKGKGESPCAARQRMRRFRQRGGPSGSLPSSP